MFRSLVLRESKRARVPFSWHAPLRLSRLSILEHMRTYRSFVAYPSVCETIKLVSRSPIRDHSLSLSLLLFVQYISKYSDYEKHLHTLSVFNEPFYRHVPCLTFVVSNFCSHIQVPPNDRQFHILEPNWSVRRCHNEYDGVQIPFVATLCIVYTIDPEN